MISFEVYLDMVIIPAIGAAIERSVKAFLFGFMAGLTNIL